VDSSDTGKILFGRMLVLLPIAVCAYFIIESQDRTVRMLAFLALVLLAQLREWMLLSKFPKSAKG